MNKPYGGGIGNACLCRCLGTQAGKRFCCTGPSQGVRLDALLYEGHHALRNGHADTKGCAMRSRMYTAPWVASTIIGSMQ